MRARAILSAALAVVCGALFTLNAQVFRDSWSTVPTAKAGPMPRTKEGKPDLSGYWQHRTGAPWNILDHKAEYGIPAAPGIVEGDALPYKPGGIEKRDALVKDASLDPEANCHMSGVPRVTYAPFPFKIVEKPDEVVILYENVHTWRVIPIGGNHQEGPPTWMGNSVAHWEGDTLVVDVTNQNDKTWFDMAGNWHSDAIHVVERYQPIDANTIWYQATIEDPKVFTKPWRMRFPLYRPADKNFTLLEFECSEGERDLQHYVPAK